MKPATLAGGEVKGIEAREKKKIKKRRGSWGRDKKFKIKKYGDVNGPIWASRIIVHLVKLSRGNTYIEVVLRDYVALEDVGLIPSGMDQKLTVSGDASIAENGWASCGCNKVSRAR